MREAHSASSGAWKLYIYRFGGTQVVNHGITSVRVNERSSHEVDNKGKESVTRKGGDLVL